MVWWCLAGGARASPSPWVSEQCRFLPLHVLSPQVPTSFLLSQPLDVAGRGRSWTLPCGRSPSLQYGVPWWHPGTLKGNLKDPIVDHLLASLGVVTSAFLPLPGLDLHSAWGILYTSVKVELLQYFLV